MNKFLALLLVTLLLGLQGCGANVITNQVSDSGATQAQSSVVPLYRDGMTYEQWAINQRALVTNDPTKIMWLHMLNMEGKPIQRVAVHCKTISAGKSLVPKTIVQVDTANLSAKSRMPAYTTKRGEVFYTNELLGVDGAFGSSGEYKYWFDPMGRYNEIGSFGGGAMCYLLTDYPIDLESPEDKITGLYNIDKMANEWQKEKEAGLKAEVLKLNSTNR